MNYDRCFLDPAFARRSAPLSPENLADAMKVNLGCGQTYKEGWVNVDASPDVRADIYMDAFEFVATHGAEVDELYMGHFLEHLLPASAAALLAAHRAERLPEGAEVSAVVPDMRAIFAAYDRGELTNEELNDAVHLLVRRNRRTTSGVTTPPR